MTVDQRILALAKQHNGAVDSRSLESAGVSGSTIRRRVATGFLRRVARGIYVVVPLENATTFFSAVQLAIPDAIVSHRSAARIHGMHVFAPLPELVVPRGTHHLVTGARLHESRRLALIDIEDRDGFKVTTPARTLWDLASTLGPTLHREVVTQQLTVGKPIPQQLVACHQSMARQGRNGTKQMRELLLSIVDDEPFPESELELRVLAALIELGAPALQRQFKPPWYDGVRGVVDFAEPVGKTIIEADGRRWHASELSRRRDLQRDLLAGTHGWFVYRVGWHEVVHRSDTVMNDLATLLRRRHDLARSTAS